MALRQIAPGAAGLANFSDGLRLSPSMYFTYAEQNRTFQSLGVWIPGTANRHRTGRAGTSAHGLESATACLQTLGVPPALGAGSAPADQEPGRSAKP